MTIGAGLLGTFSNGMEKFLYQFFSLFSGNWILCSSKESVTVALLLGLADALLDELVPEFHFCLRIDISFLVRVDSGILSLDGGLLMFRVRFHVGERVALCGCCAAR